MDKHNYGYIRNPINIYIYNILHKHTFTSTWNILGLSVIQWCPSGKVITIPTSEISRFWDDSPHTSPYQTYQSNTCIYVDIDIDIDIDIDTYKYIYIYPQVLSGSNWATCHHHRIPISHPPPSAAACCFPLPQLAPDASRWAGSGGRRRGVPRRPPGLWFPTHCWTWQSLRCSRVQKNMLHYMYVYIYI